MKFTKHVKLDFEEYCDGFRDMYLVTNNSNLRTFQYKILHSAIVLNMHLFRWKIKSSNQCYYCNDDKETLNHFFWECRKAQIMWAWVIEICSKMQKEKSKEIVITQKNVSMNTIIEPSSHVFNFICLAAKKYLYSNRGLQKDVSKKQLENTIIKYQRYEYY